MANAILNGLLLGGMYALDGDGADAAIRRRPHHEPRLWRFPDRRLLRGLLAVHHLVGQSNRRARCSSSRSNFGVSWAVYSLLLTPLVERAKSRDALEVDSLLATFGLLFVIQGVVLVIFGGAYYSYTFLSIPVPVLGATLSANRILAFAIGLR